MSQPPLSNQIKALEKALGVQLFIQGKRCLGLAKEGYLLLRRAVQNCRTLDAELEQMGGAILVLRNFLSDDIIERRRHLFPLLAGIRAADLHGNRKPCCRRRNCRPPW